MNDPGPVCFVCGNNSPDAVRVEILAWTNDSGVLAATASILGRNVCFPCLRDKASTTSERLAHDVFYAFIQWRGRQARKKRT